MKKFFLFSLLLSIASLSRATETPAANQKAVVVAGNARFTVLTDRLIRMEWAEDGVFEDRASLTFINRNLPVPGYTCTKKGKLLTLRTKALTLTYQGNESFSGNNLKVQFKLNGKTVTWTPDTQPSGNLKGTTRTLDRCEGFSQISRDGNELENGILSRDGWAFIDDTQNFLFEEDNSSWKSWVKERPAGTRQDGYLFAYGHDYKAALKGYTAVAGKIPLPPRYTLGYWWSRYWIYTDTEILDLVREIREREIPIDVFVIDMDWHETWTGIKKRYGKDPFGQNPGWTGYTWNRDLFPDPEGFLKDLHKTGCKTSLNLHPASGIQPYEEFYPLFVEDYLSRTRDYDGPDGYVYGKEGYYFQGTEAAVGSEGWRAPVPFRMDQQEWAESYFKTVIHPLEQQGVDFWWLDWQQWKESKYLPGLSNTFWLNHVFWEDKLRQSRTEGLNADRPLIYHRWGGLGSHRYQLGFSGDTYDDWSVLAFLPYFTATASNVGYAYWGHDIGGHMQKPGKGPTDGEMYTRWLQYGVFTPIFKTHSTQSANLDRRIWSFPEYYDAMKAAIELRYSLSPYIYTAAREAFDTGLGICRPLYYDYPETEAAYTWKEEFLFGDRILATALCQPMKEGKTERKIWFPAGTDWYDMAHHRMEKGGTNRTLYYSLEENPWYVKSGSILPLSEEGIQNLQEERKGLRLLVIPGKERSEYLLYEDDGISQAYTQEYATTLITKECSANGIKITIGARKGTYKGALTERKIKICLEGTHQLPSSVLLDGQSIPLQGKVTPNAVYVELPVLSASQPHVIQLK